LSINVLAFLYHFALHGQDIKIFYWYYSNNIIL